MMNERDLKLAERNLRIAARRLTIEHIRAKQWKILEDVEPHPVGPERDAYAREFMKLVRVEAMLDTGGENLAVLRAEQRVETRAQTRGRRR